MSAFKLFGRIVNKPVYLIKLTNGKIELELLSFGATVRSLRVADRYNNFRDVCLGYETIEEYLHNDGYVGATVGRNANRIGSSRFTLNGKEYVLSSNEGENQLHGGIEGFSHKCWNFSCTENSVTFTLDSADGDEGYPGNLRAEVCFSIKDTTLRISYKAISDADTVVNLTNHAYFNLGGHDSGSIATHSLLLGSESYTPCGEGNIPTGEIDSVADTPLDFRSEKSLINSIEQLKDSDTRGIDHNFVLSAEPAATLYCPESGIEMICRTSLEGIQVYSAGFLSQRAGKNGAIYGQHHAICLETQHFPDAVNHSGFPSSVLKAGEEYREWTEYSFFVK